MIFGVLIRVVLRLGRRRGLPVPDPSRLRLRPPRFGLADHLIDQLADRADDYLRPRQADPGNETR
ncbi:MAG: hypothetical protein J2P26_01780 [Nocardiopsaceae bacterium]|nr:hypothetical protein [Nocardiopsaceae bacterium]